MTRHWPLALAMLGLLFSAGFATSQPQPDLGPITEPIDEALGQVVPPVLNTTYTVLGQNISREDVRLFLDLNITRAYVGLPGLILGSGNMEIDATVDIRAELRVISSERIKEAIIGHNPYNISAENSTFLTHVYLPAEVFRLTLAAEAVALFQAEQERALHDFIEDTVPELQIINIDIAWSNVFITHALTDLSLTEPPIVVELRSNLKLQRVESLPSLLSQYLGVQSRPEDGGGAFVSELKEENGDLLRARDFFAAAAYTQLLNLSMQPGWSLDVTLRVPRGFTFEYFNDNVEVSDDRRTASFRIDAANSEDPVEEVILASLTQRRAVASAMFAALWVVAAIVGGGFRAIYAKRRVPRLLKPKDEAGEPVDTDLVPKPRRRGDKAAGSSEADPPGGEPKGVPSSSPEKSEG